MKRCYNYKIHTIMLLHLFSNAKRRKKNISKRVKQTHRTKSEEEWVKSTKEKRKRNMKWILSKVRLTLFFLAVRLPLVLSLYCCCYFLVIFGVTFVIISPFCSYFDSHLHTHQFEMYFRVFTMTLEIHWLSWFWLLENLVCTYLHNLVWSRWMAE